MAQLRLEVSSFRSMLRNLLMLEAFDDDIIKKADALDKMLHSIPDGYVQGANVSPEEQAKFDAASNEYARLTGHKPISMNVAFKLRNDERIDAMLRSYHTDERRPQMKGPGPGVHAIKQAPASKPITKDYVGRSQQAPYQMPVKRAELTHDDLKKSNPSAFKALPVDGRLEVRGPYVVLHPKQASARMMVWAGVPPKGEPKIRNEQGKLIDNPRYIPEKPRTWRTVDELTQGQRESLGYIDPRDKGDFPRKEPTPYGQKFEIEDNPSVRIRGGGGGILEPEIMGSTPAASGPGGTPSHAASAALRNAQIAKGIKPDLESMDIKELEALRAIAARHAKSSTDSSDACFVKNIDAMIKSRNAGVKPLKGNKK